MGQNEQICYVALGGNMPSAENDVAQTLRAGAARLGALTGAQITLSSLYQTRCFPPGAGPDYVNAAAALRYADTPHALLDVLHRIEAEFGRKRVQRWGQRTLDLDLIAFGDTVLPDPDTHARWRTLPAEEQRTQTPDQLLLPHPRLQDRAFVLVPLADLAPDWVHPILGLSVSEMVARLAREAVEEVVPL